MSFQDLTTSPVVAALEADRRLREAGSGARLLLQIHDELVFVEFLPSVNFLNGIWSFRLWPPRAGALA